MKSLSLAWCIPIVEGFCLGLVAMALHECAHIVAAWAVGIRVKRIGLNWKGLYTLRDTGPPLGNLVVAIAGPLMNVLLVISSHWWPMFGLANAIFAVVNLLPITSSDGLRVARCWQEISQNRSNDAWKAAKVPNEIPRMEEEEQTVATQ